MRLGLFGGSFDPVHYGHLLLAEICREECHLDQVWFMPAATAPHKRNQGHASDSQRLEMLRLAIAGQETFQVSDVEIERGGISYTVDTLKVIRAQRPTDELFFLIGADSLDDFHNWREPKTICQLATIIVVDRHGSQRVDLERFAVFADPQRLEEIRKHRVEFPLIEISSTDIRHRAAAGKSIRFRLPRAVEKYIETNKLYTAGKTDE